MSMGDESGFNTRERFLEIMNFNPNVRTLKWEYAYWGSTIKRWYDEGLPMKHYPKISTDISTITASLYTAAWIHEWKEGDDKSQPGDEEITPGNNEEVELPDGLAVMGNFFYRPNQGLPVDTDVSDYFCFDNPEVLVNVEQLFCPQFQIRVLEEDEDSMVYVDLDGVTRKMLRKESTIPTALDWPIRDWESWLRIKEERLATGNMTARFPSNWNELVNTYRNRDYPLAVGGYPHGFFGLLAHLLGYKNLFYLYYDAPDLIHDMLDTFTSLWIEIWEEILSYVDIDVAHIFEDVSSGKGSMISPSMVREFMIPYYQRITGFLKNHGVNVILVDTDGNCNELIPLFIEGGVTGMYPMEASAGMDILKVRKEYPGLQILGGVPKLELALGEKRIDEILVPVEEAIGRGGYIPFCDHSIPPEVQWKHFKYYRENLNRIIEDRERFEAQRI
jgi:uroporphyrinogen decarboxylase